MLKFMLPLIFLILPSCDWIAHRAKISMELEDIGVEAAKEEVELSKKLAEKELDETKR